MLIDESKYNVSISRLKMGDNYKDITRDAIDKLKRSLMEDGQLSPILVDNREESGKILGGNHQYVAIKELIEEKKWPYGEKVWATLVVPDNDNHAKILALKHNTQYDLPSSERLAEWGQSLLDTDYPLIDIPVMTDFKEMNLLDVMDEVGPGKEVIEDKPPEVSTEPAISKLGEVYQLGRHRLMCGDSTKIEDVEKLMNGQKAELLFTSPPYLDMRTYNGASDLTVDTLVRFIPTYKPFVNYQVVNLGLRRKGGEIDRYWDGFIDTAEKSGYKLLSWNVWNRQGSGFSMGEITAMFAIEHEFIFVFGEKIKKLNLTVPNKTGGEYNDHSGVRQQDGKVTKSKPMVMRTHRQISTITNVFSEQSREWTGSHPAIFPIALPAEYIEAMTSGDEITVDCFGGSGSTLIACEQLNRTCYMMEIDPKYCDVIRKRYAKFIGKEDDWQSL